MQMTTNYVLQLEERCFSANQMSLELLQQVRGLESNVSGLETDIEALKAKYEKKLIDIK